MTDKTRNPSQTPEPESPEPRGGQAQKPAAPAASFYDSALTRAAQKKLSSSQKVEGLNLEIGLLRMRIKSLLNKELEKPTVEQTMPPIQGF